MSHSYHRYEEQTATCKSLTILCYCYFSHFTLYGKHYMFFVKIILIRIEMKQKLFQPHEQGLGVIGDMTSEEEEKKLQKKKRQQN